MVQFDQDKSTQCAVYDQTPDSEQKKINIVVRPAHTVAKVISDIKTQYRYDSFELVLQPISGKDLVYLNERSTELIYEVDGFEPNEKNILILIPQGKWNGDVKTRYEFGKPLRKTLTNGIVTPKKKSPTKTVVKQQQPEEPSVDTVDFARNTIETTSSREVSSHFEEQADFAIAQQKTVETKTSTTISPNSERITEEKKSLREEIIVSSTSAALSDQAPKTNATQTTLANSSSSSLVSGEVITLSNRTITTSSIQESLEESFIAVEEKTTTIEMSLEGAAPLTGELSETTVTIPKVVKKSSPSKTKKITETGEDGVTTVVVVKKTTKVKKSEETNGDGTTKTTTTTVKKKSPSKSKAALAEAGATTGGTTVVKKIIKVKKTSPAKTAKSTNGESVSAETSTTTSTATTTSSSTPITEEPQAVVSSIPTPPPPPPPPPATPLSPPAPGPAKTKTVIKKKIVKKVNAIERKVTAEQDDTVSTTENNELPEQPTPNLMEITNGINDLNHHDAGLSPPSSMTTVTNATNSDSLNLSPMSEPDPLSDDDLALGASASPTETDPMQCSGDLSLDASTTVPTSNYKINFNNDSTAVPFKLRPPMEAIAAIAPPTNNGYVGLVNQAMTCYLNSLLQALYMTPEFRNALYRWEFDNDNESSNIPYQLQKLFLNLQTSKKSAVETTDLTRSFGWNSSEAWQQHDIQELCRVMFDALEHRFKNTKQANLISNLYEGKMIDYVKCLECNTEKTRADTFLDIPLPVKPFGSQVAYGSIEEALSAFVQPETLDGNNQYFCEKCNKKCDAHKGLKFKNFPYILTLHLKRFDFDYTTMYRIKLNDKVTFPQILNLNGFVETNETAAATAAEVTSNSNGVDDCSTTDSGSAMDMEDNWSSGVVTTASSITQNETDINEDDLDDGIDLHSNTENIRNRVNSDQNIKQHLGPFTYELFAIMIHSGSASGGHYYAYIKELDNNEWFCFNDQTVSPITQEDIQKSFGGGIGKAYYSSVYSSSTNAYMLMYRQVDEKRNEKSMKADEFPEHIKKHLEKLKEEEENRVTRGSYRHRPIADLSLNEQIKPRVYFYNPQLKKLKMTRVYASQNLDLNAVLDSAYSMLSVQDFAPKSHCRLVGYDPPAEKIIRSFENQKNLSLTEIRSGSEDPVEFLLEYRSGDQEFEIYEPGGTTWYVFVVKLNTMEMDGPFFVYSNTFENNETLRHSIAVRLNLKEADIMVATTQRYKKAFVSCDVAPSKEAQQRLEELARAQFKDVTYMYVNVPNTDPANLEIVGIPSNELVAEQNDPTQQQQQQNPSNGNDNKLSNGFHHECNSEDSSLSDGDRTLVENLHQRSSSGAGGATGSSAAGLGGGDSQISSTSHSPQLSSPEDENNQESYNSIYTYYNSYLHGENGDADVPVQHAPRFFHAIKLDVLDTVTVSTKHQYSDATDGADEMARKPVVSYKILVDSHMKLSKFKEHLAHLIKVPENYFEINRKHDKSLKSLMNQSLVYFSEGETLSVELGKELQEGEHKAKIYFMRLSDITNDTARLPCVCEWIYTDAMKVPAAKAALIQKLQRIDPLKYKTLNMNNCRLWLKGGRSPISIFSEDDTIGCEIRSSSAIEFFVQECEDGVQPQVSDTSLTIFVRRWHPDTLKLEKFQEITLDKDSEIRSALSKLSSIPVDNVAYTKVNGHFPYTNVSLLTINSAMNWFAIPATLENYPLSSTVSGNLYFYKDATVEPKELTPEERREMNAKENVRLDNLGCVSSSTSRYSRRHERALKIYLDSPTTTASPPVDANSSMADDI
ncbi:ubiquitin carboxyl-terminal hydrolase 47 [Musca domestica]|uniref:Ubiquitin carboxyl-terminal hydrolase 47 n=1 Tax=Musca domestica TaxID=7370 RepID=A0A9J7I397_MUSDO|nr:ubiquitin carboxyl-terminal hydrolase 47 [Musca domestica]XP_005184675.2 ubiquitin carboxyl-terminal hydrolase 47 [Musca domestica]XP_019892699.2 ubiquitin carboxyl-terminal hydrolase 47 [Musca domestica]